MTENGESGESDYFQSLPILYQLAYDQIKIQIELVRAIDYKISIVLAIYGVLMSAFISKIDKFENSACPCLLVLFIGVLITGISFCVSGLWLISLDIPPNIEHANKELIHLKEDKLKQQLLSNFKNSIKNNEKELTKKKKKLKCSMVTLSILLILIAAIIFFILKISMITRIMLLILITTITCYNIFYDILQKYMVEREKNE